MVERESAAVNRHILPTCWDARAPLQRCLRAPHAGARRCVAQDVPRAGARMLRSDPWYESNSTAIWRESTADAPDAAMSVAVQACPRAPAVRRPRKMAPTQEQAVGRAEPDPAVEAGDG